MDYDLEDKEAMVQVILKENPWMLPSDAYEEVFGPYEDTEDWY